MGRIKSSLRSAQARHGKPHAGYNVGQVNNMDKTKPFESLAAQYQISNESAKYFLNRVQKSFKKAKPPQALILEFMDQQDFDSLPEPYQVASMLYANGLWTQPLHAAPPIPEDEADIYR
jgi:hypothetical protein